MQALLSTIPQDQRARNAALLAVIAVELVAATVLLALWLTPDGSGAAPQRGAQSAAAAERAANARQAGARAGKIPPRASIRVLVLNANGQGGTAASTASAMASLGYPPASTANADEQLDRSVVMYADGHGARATRLARDLGITRVTPLDGLTRSELDGATVAVLIGNDSEPR